jgi:formiminotetrahydrofolate cyclodeaminase
VSFFASIRMEGLSQFAAQISHSEERVETDRNPLDAFLKRLARPVPNPGGGSAAAHGALVGTALLEKVVRIEMARNREDQQSRSLWPHLLEEAQEVTAELLLLREQDEQAYARLAEARKVTPGDLAQAIDEAVRVPEQIMRSATRGVGATRRAGEGCARHLIADLMVSCELLAAAVEGCYHIAHANIRLMGPGPARVSVSARLDAMRDDCRTLAAKTRQALKQQTK